MQIDRCDTDEAVLTVFAALVWHTQQLREEVKKLGQLLLIYIKHQYCTYYITYLWCFFFHIVINMNKNFLYF